MKSVLDESIYHYFNERLTLGNSLGGCTGGQRASKMGFEYTTWNRSFRGRVLEPRLGSRFDCECGSVRLARFRVLNSHLTSQT